MTVYWDACRNAAHPRAGGENFTYQVCPSHVAGSSPRGRGKRGVDGGAESFVGLIPARAGKTPRRRPFTVSPPAHPRAGGENLSGGGSNSVGGGSSPRGRGKPVGRVHA